MPKAQTKFNKLLAAQIKAEFKKAEKQATRQASKYKANVASFRNQLKVGDFTNYGMVVEIKRPIIKVQTIFGEHWYNTKQLYPVSSD